MAEIQRHLIKRGKRNPISQRLHKKKDIEATAGWRLNLNRILHILVVRSVTLTRSLLTSCFQTELEANTQANDPATNTHSTVSGSDPGSSNINVVPDFRRGVSNTRPIVSNIHRSTLKTREHGQNPAASPSSTVTTTGKLLTAAQTHARSAVSTADESVV